MRTDEEGNPCPATLGEYRELCEAIAPDGAASKAVKFLDAVIARSTHGRDEIVLADDLEMRAILMPLLMPMASGLN
jgi:hypothetical protein